MWHNIVHWGQSRHFSELGYWFCHIAHIFRILLVQTLSSNLIRLQSNEFVWCLFLMYFFVFHFISLPVSLNFIFADVGLQGPYHVTHVINYSACDICSRATGWKGLLHYNWLSKSNQQVAPCPGCTYCNFSPGVSLIFSTLARFSQQTGGPGTGGCL